MENFIFCAVSGCETWPASSEKIRRLTSADNGMVRWLCGVRLEQRIRTQELHEKLGIISVIEGIRSCRLRYFGHVQKIDTNVSPRRVNDYVIPGSPRRKCLQLHWSDNTINGLKDLNNRK